MLSNKEGIDFSLIETPETLEFLARAGDERAVGTYDMWMRKIGNFDPKVNDENKSIIKR